MMRIPTREEHGSMNLGQAVAVCLYELIRGREMVGDAAVAKSADAKKKKLLATSSEFERLTMVLLEVLRASGYVKPRIVAAEEKLRRLVRRMELTDNDAEVLLGMLRQVAWKLGVEPKNDK